MKGLLKLNLTTSTAPVRVSPPPLVEKGKIIYMDVDGKGDKEYRVLKCKGNMALVMAMYDDDDLSTAYNQTSKTTIMGDLTVEKYEGSTLDTRLDAFWYETLSDDVKSAIIAANGEIECDAWYWGNIGDPDYTGTYGSSIPGTSNYTISKYAGGTVKMQKAIFVISMQDVIDYLSDESMRVDKSAMLRNVNIWKMFWNDEVAHSNKLWLQSSTAGNEGYAWTVSGSSGALSYYNVESPYIARPAFNIDLSKVSYSETPPSGTT